MNTTVTKKLQDQLRYYSRKVQRLRVKYLIVNVILVLNLKMSSEITRQTQSYWKRMKS